MYQGTENVLLDVSISQKIESMSVDACRGCQSILSMKTLRKTSTYMPCSSCSLPARTAQWSPPGTTVEFHSCRDELSYHISSSASD